MSILVAVKGWNPAKWVDALRAHAPDARIQIAPRIEDPAAVRHALVWKPEAGLLASLPNLQVIFSLGAGVDHLTSDPMLPDRPVVRIVDPDLTMRMTEWVVLQVLMHHRRQRDYDRQQADRLWRPIPQVAARQVRVGIMGLGVLGADAAAVLARLGFDVAGWSRSPKTLAGIACHAGAEGLAPFLQRTDILVVLLPLTKETRGVIDGRLIDGLAKDGPLGGPVIINAGRGGLQVEADLDRALSDGRLKAASIDVFETEPLPAESPLWSAPNLTITPHVAADSDAGALAGAIIEKIAAFERGERLTGLVDRRLGY